MGQTTSSHKEGTLKKFLLLLIGILLVLLYFRSNQEPNGFDFSFPITENTETPELIDNFEFFHPEQKTDRLSFDIPNWEALRKEPGASIYRETNRPNNFLFIFDPLVKPISIRNTYATLSDHWNLTPNPICVFNAGFYQSGGAPSLPLVENYSILPGAVTGKHITRILYIEHGSLSISNISTNSDVRAAQWAVSGINPRQFSGSDTVTNRTVIGIKDNLLYVSLTTDMTIDSIVDMYSELGVSEENIIVLDGGGSTQGRCFGEDYYVNSRVLGSTLIITNP